VLGTARAGKHGFLRGLGADDLIDYTTTDFAQAATDIDVVLDPISDDYGPRSLNTLKPGGLLIDVRGTGPDHSLVRAQAATRGHRYTEFGFTPSGEDLDQITDLVERGDLTVAVEQILPLAEAALAHSLSETGRVQGKLVLVAGPGSCTVLR
jgi:NADPH:quinone reductase-like Zn-dependent oxidoreductase